MTFDDDLQSLEEELRTFRPAEPAPELRERVSREISRPSSRRVRFWPWMAAASGIVATLAPLSGLLHERSPPSREPVATLHETSMWAYRVAARESEADLLRLLDRQSASRRRPGPVLGSSITLSRDQVDQQNRK